jgi:hypothetical protein
MLAADAASREAWTHANRKKAAAFGYPRERSF